MFQLFVFNKGLVASELATGVKAAKVVSKLIVSSIYLLWVHTFKRCALCLDNCLVFYSIPNILTSGKYEIDWRIWQSIAIFHSIQVTFMITQLIISTHIYVSATISGLLQELNCPCSLGSVAS